MNSPKRIKIISAIMISIAAVLWGFDGVILTPRLSNLNVVFVVFLLHALPFILMNAFFFKRYKELKKLDRNALISLVLVSVLGGALGTIAIVYALFLVNFQNLSVVVLLQKFQPIFAIILAAIFLHEKVSKKFYLWGIIAIIGGHFLTFGFNIPNFQTDTNTMKAGLLSVFASFAFGSSTVFSKSLLNKLSFDTATFFRYGMTALLLFPVIIILGKLGDFQLITPTNWLIFGIIALTSGTVAIMLYYYGLKNIKASHATLLELFFPISAILFDYLINGIVLSAVQWISATIMIFAIIKASLYSKRKKK